MEVPVYEGSVRCGTLQLQELGLYSLFQGVVDTDAVCRLVAEFEAGEIVLGVPAPEQGKMRLSVSIPTSRRPKGQLLRGYLRTDEASWSRFSGGVVHGVQFPSGLLKGNAYRFAWKPGEKLPCEEYLCFYRYIEEGDKSFLELKLDPTGKPEE